MELSKISRIITVIVTAYGLTSGQEKELDYYVKANQYKWQAEMKREKEIEAMIRREAERIARE